MKRTLLVAAAFIFPFAALGQGKILTTDALTGLALYPGTDAGNNAGNEPSPLPGTSVCNSKKEAVFYKIFKGKTDDAVTWYSSHLSGFKKFAGYDSQRTQIAFRNADGSLLVILTADPGAKGENAAAYSVAYERFQPGISETTAANLVLGKMVCH